MLDSIRLEDKSLNDALKCWLKGIGNGNEEEARKCRKLVDPCNLIQSGREIRLFLNKAPSFSITFILQLKDFFTYFSL